MVRQVRLLAKLSLCNLLGFNEFRFTKDAGKKKRYRLMGVVWCVLIVMMMGYVGSLSCGLVYMGMGYYVPAALSMCVAVMVFIFTMLKAGPVLFEGSAYEKQIALPVSVRAVIVSRFLSMYFTDMLLGLLVMLPGMAVYGVMEKPPFTFYLYGVIGGVFLPLLPLTLASVAGAAITGFSSRWRRKNLAAIVLTMLFVAVVVLGSMGMSGMEESQLEDIMRQLAFLMEERIQSVYPPGIWLSEAMVRGRGGQLCLFLGVSLGFFVVFLEALRPFYGKICALLGAHETRGNYRMEALDVKPVIRSMVEREFRRYFASVVYVTNTLMGNFLMAAAGVAVLAAGKEAIEEMVGMEGIVERLLPAVLGMLSAMSPMSVCSVSMEGKQWWMMQTLPVTGRDVLRGKVWASILTAAPFYLAAVLLSVIAVRPDGWGLCCILAVPLIYIIFGAKTGAAVNCRFPVLEWENETRVVKESAATFIMMLAGIASGIVPMGALMLFRGIPAFAVYAVWVCVLLAASRLADRSGEKNIGKIL